MLGKQGYPHIVGEEIERSPDEVLIKEDLKNYLSTRYAKDGQRGEIERSSQPEGFSSADLYESTADHEDGIGWIPAEAGNRSQKDLYVELIDYSGLTKFREPSEGSTDSG